MIPVVCSDFGKLSWLWFLPALFMISCINYPLLGWSQRRAANKKIDRTDYLYLAGLSVDFFIWCCLNTWAGGAKNGYSSLLPITVWIFAYNVFYFIAQPFLQSKFGDKGLLALKLIGPLCAMTLNEWKDGKNQEDLYGFMCMLNYDIVFMAQGIVDHLYIDQ